MLKVDHPNHARCQGAGLLDSADLLLGDSHQPGALAAGLVGLVDLEHGGPEQVAAGRLDAIIADSTAPQETLSKPDFADYAIMGPGLSCRLDTPPRPRDATLPRMPSSACKKKSQPTTRQVKYFAGCCLY